MASILLLTFWLTSLFINVPLCRWKRESIPWWLFEGTSVQSSLEMGQGNVFRPEWRHLADPKKIKQQIYVDYLPSLSAESRQAGKKKHRLELLQHYSALTLTLTLNPYL
ncbi:hypothetical protein V8E53_012036 [Lactarius tabidus]